MAVNKAKAKRAGVKKAGVESVKAKPMKLKTAKVQSVIARTGTSKTTRVKTAKAKTAKAQSAKVKATKKMKKGARLCSVCSRAIPLARLKILPGTTTCVKCATVERYSSLDIPDYAFAQPPDGARIEDEEES